MPILRRVASLPKAAVMTQLYTSEISWHLTHDSYTRECFCQKTEFTIMFGRDILFKCRSYFWLFQRTRYWKIFLKSLSARSHSRIKPGCVLWRIFFRQYWSILSRSSWPCFECTCRLYNIQSLWACGAPCIEFTYAHSSRTSLKKWSPSKWHGTEHNFDACSSEWSTISRMQLILSQSQVPNIFCKTYVTQRITCFCFGKNRVEDSHSHAIVVESWSDLNWFDRVCVEFCIIILVYHQIFLLRSYTTWL